MVPRYRRRFLATLYGGTATYLLWHFAKNQTTSHVRNHESLEDQDLRESPLELVPEQPIELSSATEKLHILFRHCLPSWRSLKTSCIYHALRLWGSEFSTSRESNYSTDYVNFSGEALHDFLFDSRIHAKLAPGEAPLLRISEFGVSVRTGRDMLAGQFAGPLGHVDDLLALCCEIGKQKSSMIWAKHPKGQHESVRLVDLITHTLSRTSYHQQLYWTAEVAARYLLRNSWKNHSGTSFTLDQIASVILTEPPDRSPCLGTHRIHALAVLLEASRKSEHLVISEVTSSRIATLLTQISSTFVRRAHHGVFTWSQFWNDSLDTILFSDLFSEVTSVGHHIEWMAISQPELRPPTEIVRRVIRHLVNQLVDLLDVPDASIVGRESLYLPMTHFARGICQITNHAPVTFLQQGAK
jgi:hypothetical protein